MQKFIDLHTHSTASDGTMSPTELVIAAKEAGLSAVALTDHDTFGGVNEASSQALQCGIELIPGVEISVDFKSEMHILGYFEMGNYNNFNRTLDDLKESRNNRNPKIIRKLNEMGMSITIEDARNEAKGKIVGRPHIGKAMIKLGFVKTLDEAFKKYLSEGKPAYFKKERLSVEEGIVAISDAGGIPVLAHPIFLNLDTGDLDSLLETMKSYGLAGVEAYYSENSDRDTGNILRLAMKHNLIATGGSDFHGANKPTIQIGTGHGNLKIPYSIIEELRLFRGK